MASDARDQQALKGVLPMLVFAPLTERDSYGYELVTRLQVDGLGDIATGTGYPALTRLESEGHFTSRLVASSSGRARKYYVPTRQGAADLRRAARSWRSRRAMLACCFLGYGAGAVDTLLAQGGGTVQLHCWGAPLTVTGAAREISLELGFSWLAVLANVGIMAVGFALRSRLWRLRAGRRGLGRGRGGRGLPRLHRTVG